MKIERINYIERLRVIACISVLIYHTLPINRTSSMTTDMFEKYISTIIPTILRFAAPMFLMITGFLFLNKKNKLTYKQFFKKYTLKYIIGILVFGFTFSLSEIIMYNRTITLNTLTTAITKTITGNTWDHMWYLYTLVGLLLVIPLIQKIKDEKKINYIILILLFSSVIYPFIRNLLKINVKINFQSDLVYILYILLGYKYGNRTEINIKNYIIGLVLIITLFVFIDYLIIYENKQFLMLTKEYNSPLIMLETLVIFNIVKIRCKNIIKFEIMTSKNSYGIYIIHPLIINMIYKVLNINLYSDYFILKLIFMIITIFITTNIIVVIMKKLPIIKKIV